MVSYLASPTPLNTLFQHPGLLYHVQPGNSNSSGSSSSSSGSFTSSGGSSNRKDPQQRQWTADMVLLVAIDAARCMFCWSLLCAAAAAAAAVGDLGSAAADTAEVLQAVLPASDLADGAESAVAQSFNPEAAVRTSDAQQQLARSAVPMPADAAVAAGVLASLAGRLGLGATDLIQEHSLDGMRSRAFGGSDGTPRPAAVQQVAGWPLFTPGAEVKSLLVGLVWGLLPSFVRRSNRGVWTLWEGKAARSRRLMRARLGFVVCKQHA
jgi:hypothetical protein